MESINSQGSFKKANSRQSLYRYILQDFLKLHLFCPKVGKPKLPRSRYVGFCRNGTCHFAQRGLHCPSPFLGQTVTRALIPTYPFALNLGMQPDKKLAGIGINLHLLLAKKLRFRPNFSFNRAGLFEYGTKSFSEGYYKDVSENVTISPIICIYYYYSRF